MIALRFLRSLVERSWNHFGQHALPANFHFQGRIDRRVVGWNVSECNVLFQKRSRRAASDIADLAALLTLNFISVARDAAVHHLQPDKCPLYAVGLRLVEGFASNECRLLHFAEAIKARLPNVDGVGDLVTIKRKLGLKAQSVPCTQTTG